MDASDIAIIAGAFAVAGLVKGVVGMSLITVSLAVMTHFHTIHDAIVLVVVPTFLTNIWQGVRGADRFHVFKRFLPLYIATGIGVFAGSHILARNEPALLHPVLGLVLITYAIVGLSGFKPRIPQHAQSWAGGASGAISGLLGGMTGSMIVPTAPFLSALRLEQEEFILACGQFFLIGSIFLGAGLIYHGLMNLDDFAGSTAAVVPAVAGMIAGGLLRTRIPQAGFQKVLLLALLVIGANLLFSLV